MPVLTHKEVITRKSHFCFGCSRKFNPGSQMTVTTAIEDGRFDKLYWCPTCNEWFNRYHKYDDLISEGELVTDDDWIALKKEMEGE